MVFALDRFLAWRMPSSNRKESKQFKELICGFLLDEVINPTGEFYANSRISVGRADPNKDISDDEAPKDP